MAYLCHLRSSSREECALLIQHVPCVERLWCLQPHPISTNIIGYQGEIISHADWRYVRFPLSQRAVEELLFVRGVIVSYEAIRKWCRKFHIPPNLVVERVTAQRKPPEVRIQRFRNQSCERTLPPSTSTPHCPACLARHCYGMVCCYARAICCRS